MARLPLASRDSVPEDQRSTFDEMIRELGSVPRYGPGSVMVHVPKAHKSATGLNHYLRDESSLPKKIQELAMLVTARELDCQHIWNAHAASALSRGAFQAALEQFGRQGVIELSLVMGNYSLLALLINSFDTDLPPDRTEPLLPV